MAMHNWILFSFSVAAYGNNNMGHGPRACELKYFK